MTVVAKVLLFTAAIMVLLGAWLLFTSRQPLIGALVMVAGVADAMMAWGLTKRG